MSPVFITDPNPAAGKLLLPSTRFFWLDRAGGRPVKDFCVALGVRRPESVKWGLRPPFAPLVGGKKAAARAPDMGCI